MEQWITDLLDQHINEEGGFDVDAFKAGYDAEAPKQYVPKSEFNKKNDELKEARETLKSLEESDSTEDLKKELADYQTKLKEVEQERASEKKQQAILSALTDAVDPEFVASLIKDNVELDDDGNIKGLEDLLKEKKEKQPYLFKQEEKKEKRVEVDNQRLTNTKARPLTKDDIMSIEDDEKREEAINANLHVFV